jgi:hypothetical protein
MLIRPCWNIPYRPPSLTKFSDPENMYVCICMCACVRMVSWNMNLSGLAHNYTQINNILCSKAYVKFAFILCKETFRFCTHPDANIRTTEYKNTYLGSKWLKTSRRGILFQRRKDRNRIVRLMHSMLTKEIAKCLSRPRNRPESQNQN